MFISSTNIKLSIDLLFLSFLVESGGNNILNDFRVELDRYLQSRWPNSSDQRQGRH